MLLKPLTLAAGLLALPAAQAFLIPPEVSETDIHIANTIESIGPQVAESQIVPVAVECPGCPILLRGRHGRTVQLKIDRPSHLEMVFSIDRQPDHDRLLVNGFDLYPSRGMSGGILSAPQVVDREWKKEHKPHYPEGEHRRLRHRLTPQPQALGFGLKVSPPKPDADGQFELVEVELQILEVGVAFVDGIPSLNLKLIKDRDGRLLISRIDKVQPEVLAPPPAVEPEGCLMRLFRWLAIARKKLDGSNGFAHCHDAAKHPSAFDETLPHHGPHHHHHHHHPHADNWRMTYEHRHWGKLLKHMASHILLPVLIGIVAGVSISLIGMAVGTVLVSLWNTLSGRRRHGANHRRHRSSRSHRHKVSLKEAAAAEEKAGLMEYQDAPLSYEEAETAKTTPSYEETETAKTSQA
ncbi:hypothetical protein VTG60DRAFT_2481 [Thermothelomyces hinnuleus]